MITTNDLINLCTPYPGDDVYFRPFVCKGDLLGNKIFLVGINPATPIKEIDVLEAEKSKVSSEDALRKYALSLTNYNEFQRYYGEARKRAKGAKKPKSTPTRTVIDDFASSIKRITGQTLIETNVIPYPTANVKDLKKIPLPIRNRAREIFYTLLTSLEPSLLILHGKRAIKELIGLLTKDSLLTSEPSLSHFKRVRVEDMEQNAPLFSFQYQNGNPCFVAVSRHFMYHGVNGENYPKFKEKIEYFLTQG